MVGTQPASKVPWKTAWVTGASSGIGQGFARRLSEAGCRVAVSARSADALNALATEHEGIVSFPVDLRDKGQTTRTAAAVCEQLGVPDLVFLSAGIGFFSSAARLDSALFRQAMETNVIAIADILSVIVPRMLERGSGHIALLGSLAGYRGLPKGITYAPTKAAVRSMADCLQIDLAPKGLTISVINPGYIDTPMIEANDFPMPFIVPLDRALDHIMKGLVRGRFEITFPWQMALVVKLGSMLPNGSYFRMVQRTIGPRR